MPHGFFTIEQCMFPHDGVKAQWIPILHLDSCQSLTTAIKTLEGHGKPGLYRISQTQRCVWAEIEKGKLRLHGSHVSSYKSLAELMEIYEREGGRRPVKKATRDRARIKAGRRKSMN